MPRLQLGGGNALPEAQRIRFERSLGADLSGVRVHTDGAANDAAASVGARAFARGSSIAFGAGQYNPGTPGGDKLLAHEVAHTVQQSGSSPSGPLETTQPGDAVEKQADTAASAMVAGEAAEVSSAPVAIARKGLDEEVEAPGGEGARGESSGDEAEEGGEWYAERVGQEEEEGTEPISDLSNEAGKEDIKAQGEALPEQGGAEELANGGLPEVQAPGGGGGDDQVELSPELQATLAEAQADSKAAIDEAKGEAEAFKAETIAQRDRFEAQQNALTLEQLKSMTGADKRATLVEMGYDEKSVKKMKDAELDGIIAGRIETEQRKTKILGMDPEELAALSPGAKAQFLVDLGIDRKDVDKIGPQAAARAFDDIMRVAHVPGQHKVKVKVKGGLLGKSWEVSIKVDAEGNPEIEAQKKGGFLSKLWGWVKLALPIIAVVLAPVTAGASLIVLAVYQTVTAIAQGDWMGAVLGAAGALVGLGAINGIAKTAEGAATAMGKIAQVAGKVQKVAQAAQAAMVAAKAKNAGGLLAALSAGAGAFAGFAAKGAEKFAETMKKWSERLDKWAKIINGSEKLVKGVKSGDAGAALAGAFDAASAGLSKKDGDGNETSGTAKDLSRYARIATFVSAGQKAATQDPPGFGSIVDSALGIAGELELINQEGDAAKITAAATKLGVAVASKDPAQITAAAMALAESIHTAKIKDSGGGAEAGSGDKEAEKAKIAEGYARANRIVKGATQALKAASKKPRPDYASAVDAAAQLVAELTDDKRLDAAAKVTSAMDAWTRAIGSKNELAILQAGMAFGTAINDLRGEINEAKNKSKAAAETAGQPLPEGEGDAGDVPAFEAELLPSTTLDLGLVGLPGAPGGDAPIASVETSEEFRYDLGPRDHTPGANYTVVPGDTFSGIASRFNTSVAILRAQNPQIVADRIYEKQRIFVPGADVLLTPSVTTSEEFRVPGAESAPGTTPDTTPGTGTTPGTPSLDIFLDIVNAAISFEELGGWPSEFTRFLKDVKTAGATVKALSREGRTASEQYKKAHTILSGAAAGTRFADELLKKIAGYEGAFGDLINVDAHAQPLRVITSYARLLRDTARVTKIPLSVAEGVDSFILAAGYRPDGSPASMLERIEAAGKVVSGAVKLEKELAWMKRGVDAVFPRLSGTIASAVSAVRSAATSVFQRIGSTRAAEILTSNITRALEVLARQRGAAVASQVGVQWAQAITTWGSTLATRLAANTGLQELLALLGGRLGFTTVSALATPLMIAYEVLRFELVVLPAMYLELRDSVSLWLTTALYGQHINTLKAQVRSCSVGSRDECASTIRLLYNGLFPSARAHVRTAWRPFIVESLRKRQRISFLIPEAAQSAEALITRLDEYYDHREETAAALKDIALEYINVKYAEEFKRPAPED